MFVDGVMLKLGITRPQCMKASDHVWLGSNTHHRGWPIVSALPPDQCGRGLDERFGYVQGKTSQSSHDIHASRPRNNNLCCASLNTIILTVLGLKKPKWLTVPT